MRFDILAQLLQDAGLGTQGQTIFIHHMDVSATSGILLRAPLEGIKNDYNLPGYHKTKIQVIVRGLIQADGDALAARVSNTLTFYNRIFLNPDNSFAMQVNHICPASLPIIYPRSPAKEIEWSITFETCYVLP